MRYVTLILLSILLPLLSMARVITGSISDSQGNHSIVGVVYSTANGSAVFDYEGQEAIDIDVEAAGHEPGHTALEPEATTFSIQLIPSSSSVQLDELEVIADRSGVVKRLANGNRFFLSPRAKDMNDPFMALREIPTLESDPFNATLKTLSGKSPLILINGVELNSGIKPILPKDIEYVEVIDAVPARYLARGVTAIVNIKLRENRPPYLWTELATRHEIPLREGFGAWYFEVGNEKYSLYGRTSASYTHNDRTEGYINSSDTGYERRYDWTGRKDDSQWFGELLFKAAPTSKDYLAVQGYLSYDRRHNRTSGEGTYVSENQEPFSMTNDSRDRSSIATVSAYYKHEFAESTQLEVRGGYNHNRNTLTTVGEEAFGSIPFDISYLFRNRRNSGNAEVTFSHTLANGAYLQAGSLTTLLSDRIELSGQPLFRHSNYDEYLFASFTSQWSKLYYMLSAGLQATWLTAREESNRYLRPRATLSGTWQFNPSNSIQLYYTLTNRAPSAASLNPYATSTDSLTVSRGNPYLVPQQSHDLSLTYSLNKGPVYTALTLGGDIYTDMITSSGYTEPSGVYVSTYANQGRYRQVYSTYSLSYSFWKGNLSGRVSGSATWWRSCYDRCRPKDAVSVNGSLTLWWKKFMLWGDISVTPRTYSDISVTRNPRPVMANVQVNYNILDNLYVAVCLQGFAGDYRSTVTTTNGTYRNETFTRLKDTGLRPWILIRWNIRKNVKRKIRLDKVLDSQESGLHLTK